MKVITTSSPFGSRTRTRVLAGLELLGESYPRELARVLGAGLSAVQKAVRSLERDSLIVGRTMGRTRLYGINPRFYAVGELRSLARRVADADIALQECVRGLRRRPRMAGKPL